MCTRNYKIVSEGSSIGPTKKIHRKIEQMNICPFESNEKTATDHSFFQDDILFFYSDTFPFISN